MDEKGKKKYHVNTFNVWQKLFYKSQSHSKPCACQKLLASDFITFGSSKKKKKANGG